MEYLLLLIFILSTIIHLYASLKLEQKMRNISKPFILSSLLGYYCLTAGELRIYIILALIFSWLGDVFLIRSGLKWFTIGGTCFEISHIFFILGYSKDIDFANLNVALVISLELIYFVVVSIIFSKLKVHLPKSLFYPMYLYLFINGTMNCFALLRMLSANNITFIISFIGALLFFISDSTLFFVRFKKDIDQRKHFIVMLTYSIGELLIVLGLI